MFVWVAVEICFIQPVDMWLPKVTQDTGIIIILFYFLRILLTNDDKVTHELLRHKRYPLTNFTITVNFIVQFSMKGQERMNNIKIGLTEGLVLRQRVNGSMCQHHVEWCYGFYQYWNFGLCYHRVIYIFMYFCNQSVSKLLKVSRLAIFILRK